MMRPRIFSLACAALLVGLLPASAVAQDSTSDLRKSFAEIRTSFDSAWSGLPSKEEPPAGPALKVVQPALFNQWAGVREVLSPDRQQIAGTSDGDLYVRASDNDTRRTLARADRSGRWDIEGAIWSPDSKSLSAKKVDDTRVPRITLSGKQFAPSGLAQVPYSRVGQPIPIHQVFVIDIQSGRTTKIEHGLDKPYLDVVEWSPDGEHLRLLRADRFHRSLELLKVDAASGQVRRLLSEPDPASLVGLNMMHGFSRQMREQKFVVFMPDNSFIWTSDRSGHRHLYHYDPEGCLIGSLTHGRIKGWVDRIIEVDVPNRYLYVRTNGFSGDPYSQQLVRVSLDKTNIVTIGDGPHIPQVKFSEDMQRLWMVQTGFPDRNQLDEFRSDGGWVKTLWKADYTKLYATGYKPPEVTMVLAADGKTPIRAMVFSPNKMKAGERYPVIENIYGGPQAIYVPQSPRNGSLLASHLLAQNGYVVVQMDGRGTPGRNRQFQNFSSGKFGQVEIADHAAGLRNLAKDRPYMDLDRVGVIGASWGAYFGLRAVLQAPDLYKAAVLDAGAYELSTMRVAAEPYMGCAPQSCPAAYRKGSNLALLPGLRAPLLLTHGTADNDVPIEEANSLVALLRQLGRPYRFMPLEGGDHASGGRQFDERAVAFFREHLGKR